MPSSALPTFRNLPLNLPKSRSEVMTLWANLGAHDAVCFDVDSTVVQGEFIDELADYLGVGNRVQQVTKNAMGGNMNFRSALRERLNIMKPDLKSVENFKLNNDLILTTGIEELVKDLQRRKVEVYLVSGGFQSLILPLAKQINIPESNVFANKLLFNSAGDYAGFDETEPTSMSGGKALAVSAIKERGEHRHVIMVGDGATDAEACPPANAFIGFGGNVARESVKNMCHLYVHCFSELLNPLNSKSNCEFSSRTKMTNTNSISAQNFDQGKCPSVVIR